MSFSFESFLFLDAFDRAMSNPTSSKAWETLTERYRTVGVDELKFAALKQLRGAIGFHGIAGFFHANFLSAIEPDLAHVETAARIGLELRPVDAERLMAFATHEWGNALVKMESRSGFVRQLAAARIPELMALAAGTVEAAFAGAFTARVVDDIRRIALVTPTISHTGHTPTALTLSLARQLIATGVGTKLFAPQDSQMPPLATYLGIDRSIAVDPPDVVALAEQLPKGMDATLSQSSFSLPFRWRTLAADIAAYDPDLIFFVGFFAPWMAPLFVHRPVVAMSVHSSPPIVPADVILSADEKLAGRHVRPWGEALPSTQVYFHPFRVAAKPLMSGVSRTQLGITEDAILLIIVGSRLKQEMSDGWSQQLAGLMVRRPELTLMLVGSDDDHPAAFADIPSHRLRALSHREDVGDLLALSDIYINPPRMGGGFSVAEAMAAGLPVVCFADGDGGDKVGPLAASSSKEYWRLLETYLNDPVMRQRDGDYLRTRFAERLDISRSGPSLIQAGHAAMALFGARRTLAAPS